MGWPSVFSALTCHFDSLSDLYRDWRLRRAGAKKARLSILEGVQRRYRRRAEIMEHLDRLGDGELDRRLRQYQRASGRLRMGKAIYPGRGR